QEDAVRELPILVEELPAGEAGIHVVLTIDCSQSMSGQPIADAKEAATTFVGLMQKLDYSAIVSFNHNPYTEHPFSSNIDSLKEAIAQIYATGYTAVYDAIIHSVELMTDEMKNRAIILLTDGADNRSGNSYQEALNACLAHEIRAFTIGLGLTRNSDEENILKNLASETGGLYFYSPNSSQLEEIYRAISQLLHHRYRISYTTHNPAKDSTLRHVRIEVLVNGNASSDTSSYRAPYEPTPVPPLPPVVPPVNPPIEPPVIPAPEPVFEVLPNPFTPNGDGLNDQVEFRYGDNLPTDWSILVLDRSGRVIRQLANGERFWNGKDASGAAALPGCYLFVVTSGKQLLHRGLIQLIR
ncbi:MAG: VWA domain-containing protein, partial [candidate division KSB1 bacterium]|nr:VWA domain-containing protein [candidate division KSB1 bacterium]